MHFSQLLCMLATYHSVLEKHQNTSKFKILEYFPSPEQAFTILYSLRVIKCTPTVGKQLHEYNKIFQKGKENSI